MVVCKNTFARIVRTCNKLNNLIGLLLKKQFNKFKPGQYIAKNKKLF